MLEIEVKAQVDNLDEIEQRLIQWGCVFTDPLLQKDKVFIPNDKELLTLLPGDNALRIRTSGPPGAETYLFTVKQQTDNPLVKQEKELYVSNPQDMEDIILMLGYKECSYLEKIRKKSVYQTMEICLDRIEGLGDFIEIEKQQESGDYGVIQQELFSFLQRLGISHEQRVTEGYDILQYKKFQHR